VTNLNPIAVITNRGSTRNLRGDNWIDPLLAAEANVLHIKIEQAAEVDAAVRRAAEAGAQTIVVNGGDGTADLVFGAVLNGRAHAAPPALALLPGGKTNMTASDWSLTGTPEEALHAVLRSRREGTLARHIINRPVLAVRRNNHTPPLYGAFFGAAEIVEGIHFCRRHIYPLKMPNAFSHMAAIALLLWRGMGAGTQRSGLSISDDAGVMESGHFFVVAVTALNELLLGIRPAPAEENGAPLHYLSLRTGPSSILSALPDLARKRLSSGNGRIVKRIPQAKLCFTGAYTLDGEMYESHADQPLILDGNSRLDFIRITS
jgi:hypothetical protein